MPVSPRLVPAGAVQVTVDGEQAAHLMAMLQEPSPPAVGFSLNDLVFPRKAALTRAACGEDEPEGDSLGTLVRLEREGLRSALFNAIRYGQPGAFSRTLVSIRSLKGWVGLYRGVPTLLRTTRFTNMVPRDRLARTLTHQFDRLAFECALSGHQQGRLVLYYEAIPGTKIMAYDVWFKDLPAIAAEANRRLCLLETGAPAAELPPCPAWMAKFCSFSPQCGCGQQVEPMDGTTAQRVA
jgi:hypothetical protein